ncbi:MAG: right-handed parallel beta-helix repeat-containing protein [Planctomycetota bacterium]|nr:right-handed parallel beta-helix repeat-containing protein [Planctomycetota bacterium]
MHSRMLQLEALERRITPATYTVVNTLDAGTGSLRQAITNANLNAGPDIINFAITGGTGAIQTITLATALPLITDQVTIDGTTQSGYSANTLSIGAGNNAAIKIQLDGSNFTAASGIVGLYFNSPGSSVTALSFVNFPFAIYANNNNITIKGNYFGVNADGTAQSNGLSGVGVDVATVNAAIVGGNTAADQNIFGNLTTGIVQIAGSGSSFTGNRIGLGTTNTSFMPNTTGIQINNNSNVDALNHSISANLIGKNTTGIKLIGFQGGTGTVRGTQIVGNLIGTNSPGSTNNLGNSGDAISIDDGVVNTTIGNSVKPNTIAYSNQNGVFINGGASVGNTIEYNNIRNNLGRGIFLLNGANNNIASPVLTQQIPNGAGGFTYSGFVNGVANTQYTVDFYSSLISDSRSQGANYLGSTTVTTDANGNIGFTGFAPTQNQALQGANYVVTATATNIGFGTSLFSAGPPAQISVVSGSSQTTLVGTAFANPLTAKVVDSRGDPVPNMQVQFAAPNSNPLANPATGTFPVNQQSVIAITNTVGEAVSTTLTANNAPGNFTVLAQDVNNAGIAPVSFALTNTPPAPTITSFTPTSGQVGTSVVISGSGFVGSVQVKFNGVTATNVVVNSATQITATVPTGATTGLISVTNPGGTVTTTANFTVTPSSTVTYSVTNTFDSGLGSLRKAIDDANATASDDIINFNFATGSGPYIITLNSSLPNILAASSSGSLTITGLGAPSLTIDANKNNFSIFSIDSGGNLSISGVTVSGAITSDGGAFNNSGTLSVTNSALSGNTANRGGAIANSGGGTLTVTNSTISGNTAINGAGIYNTGGSTLTVINSTLSGNTATNGGGILNNFGSTLAVINSTLYGNTASKGGGIFSDNNLTVTNSTLSGNSATVSGGGIFSNGGNLNIANTIIANSTSGGDYAGSGTIGTNSNNLVEDGSITNASSTPTGSGDILGDPNLGPLQNNGGSTFTMALGMGSAAIGAGNATISNAAPINGLDQRGYVRSSTTPSIGAFDLPSITSFTPTSGLVGTSVVISGSGFVGPVQVKFNGVTATSVVVNAANQVTATVPTGATTGLISVTTSGGTVTTTTNFTVTPSFVTPYRVTNTSDSGPGSLRQAIDDANATADDDVIEFNIASGTNPYTIILNSALPNILDASSSGTLTITGLGAPSLTISGSDPTNPNNSTRNFNIFSIDSDGDLSISGVTVSGAQTTGKGGAFNNAGTLKVSNSTISGNKAGDSGGAIYNDMGGTLTVTNSIISGNKSGDSGGGIYNSGTLTVTNSTLSGNTSTYGGGIYNDFGGTLTVTNSTFSNNLAATGGGIQNNSSLSINDSTISGNTVNRGGGIYNDFGGTLKVNNTIISGNTAKYGGGIYTRGILTVTNSTLSGNTANRGGGIRNNDTLTVIGSTISGNTAKYGGGIYNSDILTVTGSTISGNTAKYGGGIFIDMDGTLTVTNSTISGNTPDNIMDEGADKSFEVSSPSEPVPFPLNNSITKDLAILTGITQATLPDYVATIDWGDDSEDTAGVITPAPNQPGVFQILGTHTYSSLEIFTGSVTVTRVSDDESSSSDFNAVVLTSSQKDNLNGASGAVLKPGGQSADARINGINTLYVQSADNAKPVILVAAAFKDNPQAFATTLPAQQFYDVRLVNPGGRSLLTLTAKFAGGLQRGSSPYIQFAQDNSTSYKNVVSANNQVVINYINSTITVFFDRSSFPLINNLRGTVFAVVTSNTQVSSNTVTVLPATFTGGTAVSIAWGAASTLADVASAASASNTTLTFQNSRQTTLSLAPSQSKGTVILRAVNNGGTTNDGASKETIKQLTSPDILQSIIRGTIGIGPEMIGGMIKKMLPENAGNFLKEWSKVISEIKDVPNDMITPKVNAIPEINKGSSIDKPEECDDSLSEDAAFDDISKISSALGLADESSPCLNGVSPDSMLEELAFSGEINWAGLALSTLTLSQFRTFSMDKSKRVRPIKVGA